jgi:Hpt domain
VANETSQAFKLLAAVQAAIEAGDLNALRRSSDALKGSITSLLANRAFDAASTLEKTLCEDDLSRAQDACRRLQDALNSLNPGVAKRSEPIEIPK